MITPCPYCNVQAGVTYKPDRLDFERNYNEQGLFNGQKHFVSAKGWFLCDNCGLERHDVEMVLEGQALENV